jgi:oligopeptide transport system ATP-binding protein
MNQPLLSVRDLCVDYEVATKSWLDRPRLLRAVDHVSFDLNAGESLGVVGETGCGKTSLGRAVLGLVKNSSGTVSFRNRNIVALKPTQLRSLRDQMQIVFQDPLSSLNPRMTVGDIVSEPLALHRPHLDAQQVSNRTRAMIERVGLSQSLADRYPGELSGGQCQRVSIARAMILNPSLVVCDEAVSALDVSVQAQICNLLKDLQRENGNSMLFISHDLSVVRHMCQNILVMYLGRIVEYASRASLFSDPKHPYTQTLIGAIPSPDPDTADISALPKLGGDIPSPLARPSGCAFRTRCPIAIAACEDESPALKETSSGGYVACNRC